MPSSAKQPVNEKDLQLASSELQVFENSRLMVFSDPQLRASFAAILRGGWTRNPLDDHLGRCRVD